MTTNVLVVDDSSVSRKILIASLPKDWDINITQAVNGLDALEKYHQGLADIIFLDLTMPVMDGFQTLETMQKEGLDSFVIVLTADIQPEAEARVMKLGAMAFLKKPVNKEYLVTILKEHGIYD